MDLKDHARAKEERRAARRSQPRENKGPEIAWDEAVREQDSVDLPPLPGTPPAAAAAAAAPDSAPTPDDNSQPD